MGCGNSSKSRAQAKHVGASYVTSGLEDDRAARAACGASAARGAASLIDMPRSALTAAQRVYALALHARYGRAGMPWRVHDLTVRIDPRVRHLVPHVSEPSVFEFVQRTVRPGDVV